MTAFGEVSLGSEAIEFIRDCLTEGGMMLGHDLVFLLRS